MSQFEIDLPRFDYFEYGENLSQRSTEIFQKFLIPFDFEMSCNPLSHPFDHFLHLQFTLLWFDTIFDHKIPL